MENTEENDQYDLIAPGTQNTELQVVSFKNIGAFLQKYRDNIGIFKKYFQHIKQRDPFYCLICLHFLHLTKQY